MKYFFAHDFEDGIGFAQSFGFAAHHENEVAFARPPIAPGNRSIQEANAAFGAGDGNFAGKLRGNGAGVDVDAAGTEVGEDAFISLTPQNGFKRRGIADNGEQKVAGSGNFAWIFRQFGAGGNEFIGAGGGAVPDGKRVAGLQQVHAHG